MCCRGECKSIYSYKWEYITDEEYKQIKKGHILKVEIPIITYNYPTKLVSGVHKETGEVVTFKSTVEASRWLLESGLTNSNEAFKNISACCNGKKKSAYKFVWSYVE